MHIGINAQLLSFAQNYRNGGVSRYIRYLLNELAHNPGEHRYTVFVNGEDVVERLAARHPQISYVTASWPEAQPAARVAWEQFSLPAQLRKLQIEVLHSPVNVLPEWLPRQCASVVTLHDLAFVRYPEVLTTAKRLYHQTFTIRSLRRATMVITVSNSTMHDANTLVGVTNERMRTIYPCIDERFSQQFEEETLDLFRQEHDVTEGYILYLGTLEPRKNIPTLLDAYARLRQQYGRQEKLVLAGGKGWLYDSIFARVQELGLTGEIVFPGFVPDSEQALWYRGASTFAYPSLYEGFGIPVAEALACGIPVVTSNVSSLPEAGAQLALCVDPYNVEELAAALHSAITDETIRARCRTMAPSIMQQFSARSMVEQTRAVYEQAPTLLASLQRSHRTSFVQ